MTSSLHPRRQGLPRIRRASCSASMRRSQRKRPGLRRRKSSVGCVRDRSEGRFLVVQRRMAPFDASNLEIRPRRSPRARQRGFLAPTRSFRRSHLRQKPPRRLSQRLSLQRRSSLQCQRQSRSRRFVSPRRRWSPRPWKWRLKQRSPPWRRLKQRLRQCQSRLRQRRPSLCRPKKSRAFFPRSLRRSLYRQRLRQRQSLCRQQTRLRPSASRPKH
mmetsp:Transcript_62624/g.137125  ORF Transcript_62624/g.137125 Transcript_62624/m.137125 type:complete len:215 (-) Transcript_62624:153-797(-)